MADNGIKRVQSRSRWASCSGFTLLELMVTLFLIGILLTVAVPGFFDIVRNNRAAANANELVTALSIARSEAVRRGAPITLCGTTSGTSCGGGWNQRWVLFLDSAATDTATPSGITAANTLREWGAPGGDASIATQKIDGTAVTATWVRFLPRGEVRTSAGTPIVFHLEIEGCSGVQGRDIELNAVGRNTVERVSC